MLEATSSTALAGSRAGIASSPAAARASEPLAIANRAGGR